MELSNYGLPRQVKERMIREYLAGVKTTRMLSEELGKILIAIHQMLSRHKDKFLPTFEQKPIILPMKKEPSKTAGDSDLLREVSELCRQLKEARLKIEGYEIMGDILEEQYGIDLLKKSAARQSPASGNNTQE